MVKERVQYVCEFCQKTYITRAEAEDCESRCHRSDESPRLEALNLSTRTFNLLYWSGLYSVSEIALMSEKDLKKIKGFGNWCLKELKTKLAEYGLDLNDSSLMHKARRSKPQLNKNIAHYRKERKLSQAELAAIVGMDANHLSCIEIGNRYPSVNLIARLAVGLGLSVEELVGE